MENRKVTFGRIFWPSLVAALIVSVLGVLIWIISISGLIASFGDFGKGEPMDVKDKTILHMTLSGNIGEKSSKKLNPGTFQISNNLGVSDIIEGLKIAANDENVKGLFIEIDGLNCGFSSAKEIRNAIDAFEKSGKFAVAYNSGEVITQKEYYISSAANEVYGFPTSNMEFMGLAGELSFFKGTLEKLEVEMQVVRGKNNDFKSAVEPFFLDKMSDSSRLQTQRYLTSLWGTVKKDIQSSRKVSTLKMDEIADNLLIRNASDAVKYQLMDGVKYRDEVMELIAKKVGEKEDNELNLLAFEKYATKNVLQDQILMQSNAPNVAVILAEGDISVDGDGLTPKDICKQFREARRNESIKTIVFRVNSPGGSALASDEIWREVELTNKTKKVIVSMGDVAASGGYYISAPAMRIFAEPSTITGSIGVFGVIPYTGKMLQNKLGISFDYVSTNKHQALSTNRKMTPEELVAVQEEVDNIYDDFLSRVAIGRRMTKDEVNKIARGRVWTGEDAVKIGLVDELGGIHEAIAFAAKQAGISTKDTKVLYYPLMKEDKWAFVAELLEENEGEMKMENQKIPAVLLDNYNQWKKVEHFTGIQMRLPFELVIR
ncbi:MAG: signal peptide peptidase SppA [Crocinitomicaceae bacterium]